MPARNNIFTTIRTEGALLPVDLLQRISEGATIDGLTPESYHRPGEKLNEAINRSWNALQGAWASFRAAQERLPENDLGTSITRERWLLPLFRELDYGRLQTATAVEIDGRSYPISHSWGHVPVHLVSYKLELDRRTPGAAGAASASPHSLLQVFLNRSEHHLWGFLSNGYKLRILRDNVSLTRQAYVEFDLEAMMEGEVYSDFVLLWLLCHQSRVEGERPSDCWLERWMKVAEDEGTRALDQLRDGVEKAITALGLGFLEHHANAALRDKLTSGQLSAQDYYRQLLRMVYRLLFLFVAEDRDLLLNPDAPPEARERYIHYYSTQRLRRMAAAFKGTRHPDLFEGLRLVMRLLSGETNGAGAGLGLVPLGSFLFSDRAVADIIDCQISNQRLLTAIRDLALTYDQRAEVYRTVDYKNLGSDELGSVYESLLELHPQINVPARRFALAAAGGSERKITGSYYTPTSLINALLDSALDPVLNEAIKGQPPSPARPPSPALPPQGEGGVRPPTQVPPHEGEGFRVGAGAGATPEDRILNLKICDPACGSGHFLIAAANRMAKALAFVRTGEEEPPPKAIQEAKRDIISHCIYGVDINPMAVELCKVNLWMEALEPGKPLSFLDHRILVGNSLLGTTPKLMAEGIPDDAFSPIEGDDKKLVSELKKTNKADRKERERKATGQSDLFHLVEPPANYSYLTQAMHALDDTPDDTLDAVQRKEAQYAALASDPEYIKARLLADAWCAAFVWEKKPNGRPMPMTDLLYRRMEADPLADDLQAVREYVVELKERYQFFHWHIAFPDVFSVDRPQPPSPALPPSPTLPPQGEGGQPSTPAVPHTAQAQVPPLEGEGGQPSTPAVPHTAQAQVPPLEGEGGVRLPAQVPPPEGEGSRVGAGASAGSKERIRAMATKAMRNIARELRQRQTPAEVIMWEALRKNRLNGLGFRRQHPVAHTNYVVDFFCYSENLIVELDGEIHRYQQQADAIRQRKLEQLGYKVLRFPNERIYTDLENVLAEILAATQAQVPPLEEEGGVRPPAQVPPPEGEGFRVGAAAPPEGEGFRVGAAAPPEGEGFRVGAGAYNPQTGWHGGFDVVLGNPPWERIKIQEKEWFAKRAPEIANAPNAAARKRMIEALEQSDPQLYADFLADLRKAEGASHFVRTSSRYPLCGRGDVNTYSLFAETARHIIHDRGRVGLIVPSGIATDDTTKLFFQDVVQSGSLASLYDFENREGLFPAVDSRMKFSLMTMRSPHASPLGSGAEAAEFAFFLHRVEDLNDPDRRFSLSAEEIAMLNPNTRTMATFRSVRDAEITKAIYRRVPVLIREAAPALSTGEGQVSSPEGGRYRGGDENPWGIRFATMFHMSNDSHLFRTRDELEAEGYVLRGNHFVAPTLNPSPSERGTAPTLDPSPSGRGTYTRADLFSLPPEGETPKTETSPSLPPEGEALGTETPLSLPPEGEGPGMGARPGMGAGARYLPLYEAKMMHQFTHRWATYDSQSPDLRGGDAEGGPSTREMTLEELRNPHALPLPRYWVDAREVAARLGSWDKGWLLGFRNITNTTNERTAIFGLIPRVGVGHSNALMILNQGIHTANVMGLLANLNSLAFDLVVRTKLGGSNMTFFLVKQFPVIPPHTYTSALLAFIVPRVLELTYTAWDLQPFARDVGYAGPPFIWDEERRFFMRCELDALYFHLYQISRADVDYIMETFPIVKRKDEAAHGAYRTKQVILDMYDQMAGLPLTPVPAPKGQGENEGTYLVPDVSQWQTWLNPPPADPSVAHDHQA